jgi:hypothetical protein
MHPIILCRRIYFSGMLFIDARALHWLRLFVLVANCKIAPACRRFRFQSPDRVWAATFLGPGPRTATFLRTGPRCMHALAGGVSYPVLPRLRLRPPPDRLRLSRSTRTSSMPSVFITPEKPRTTLTSSKSSLFITNSGCHRPMIIGDRRRIPPLSTAATLLSQSELSTYHAVKQAGHQR